MNALRVLICDDEPLALSRLSALLARVPNVEIVGKARGGFDALAQVRTAAPDLILLDVEMPDLDGFDVVEQLESSGVGEAPLIALVTAYPQFAPEAFDRAAIDFLSKPVRLGRLERTIQRARTALQGRETGRRLIELRTMLEALRAERKPRMGEHVWVSRRGEVVRIDLDDVDRVAAEGAYVRLHVQAVSYLHREPIGSIEKRLDPTRFVRTHRSHLVRIDHVASVRRTLHGRSELILQTSERVPLGRRFAKEARRRLFQKRADSDISERVPGSVKRTE